MEHLPFRPVLRLLLVLRILVTLIQRPLLLQPSFVKLMILVHDAK